MKIAEPMASAKYVVFETAQDKVMDGLNAPFYPFPYIEGVTIDEAANDLAFISTGLVRQAPAAAEWRPDSGPRSASRTDGMVSGGNPLGSTPTRLTP